MPFLSLAGQSALVTGAAQGIGEAIATRLAAAGAHVYIADLNLDAALLTAARISDATDADVEAIQLDVTDSARVDHAFDQVVNTLGPLDILVNNAGLAGKAAPLLEQTDADWQQIIAINLLGVVYCSRAVIRHMKPHGYGRIVNIASIAGKEGNPNMTAYSATKAAVIGFTKALAKEVATENITVNAVAPAVVHTKLLDQLSPEQVDYMTQRIPMRRTGRPEEIAAVVHFLASRDASFVTGQCYDASGGRATY